MKILRYSNRKEDATTYDISTPEKAAKAWLALFHHLDKDWQCYDALQDEFDSGDECTGGCPEHCGSVKKVAERTAERARLEREHIAQQGLYRAAKKGDAKAAYQLLSERNGYEYEEWTTETVESLP